MAGSSGGTPIKLFAESTYNCSVGSTTCTDGAQCEIGSQSEEISFLGACDVCGPSNIIEGNYCAKGQSVLCEEGEYCPYEDGAVPIECPSGYYCRAGLSNPIECGSLMTCSGEGNTFGQRSWFSIVMICLVAAVVLFALMFLRWLAKMRNERTLNASEKHKETTRMYVDLVQVLTGQFVPGPMQGYTAAIKYKQAVSIEFQNLSMTIKGSDMQVLDNVSGCFPPGSMVALMGPSGGGKTTFMNALANRASYGDITGSVSLNGVEGDTIGKFPRLTGMVPQDDIMHDDLTVYENLSFSAQLRLPSSMTDEQKKAIVEDALHLIGLDLIRDSVVGSPEKRGVSGGQKKRVNIGIELVAYPRVLFLDEPTSARMLLDARHSGLDSAGSLQVARCLQRMSSLGITIVSVIHQPRASVFNCFSHVLMLAKGGRTCYLGPTSLIQEYFVSLGFIMPSNENVADWCIDVVCGQIAHQNELGEVDRCFVPEKDLPVMWLASGDTFLKKTVAPNPSGEEAGPAVERSQGGVSIDEFEQRLLEVMQVSAHDELGAGDINRLCCLENIIVESNQDRENVQNVSGSNDFSTNWFFLCNVVDLAITSRMSANKAAEDSSRRLYRLLADDLPEGSKFTVKSLAVLLSKYRSNDKVDVANDDSAQDPRHDEIVDRAPPSFVSQLATFMARDVAKFNASKMLGQCAVAVVGATIVANAKKGQLDYATLPLQSYSGMLILTLVIAASNIYVFGDERLVFRRESTTGMSVTAYWLAHNLVNILDIGIVTLVFSACWFMLISPDFSFADCYGVYILLAWVCSGIAHFFSVSLDRGSALLAAVLLPVILIAMFGGTGQFWSDMSGFGQAVVRVSPGFYATENFVALEIIALPHYVRHNDEVTEMLNLYSFYYNRITQNSLILLLQGFVWRLFTLIVLEVDVHGVPGGFWCCTCFWCKSVWDRCTAKRCDAGADDAAGGADTGVAATGADSDLDGAAVTASA